VILPARTPPTRIALLSRPARLAAVALALAAAQAPALAEVLRDPTQPPPGYGAPVAATAAREPVDAFKPEHLVTVDGQRYVMWRGHRYRVGDTVQGARIERIEESGVWVRAAEGSRKLPLYAGIEKRAR
jgi:hypothetical protein